MTMPIKGKKISDAKPSKKTAKPTIDDRIKAAVAAGLKEKPAAAHPEPPVAAASPHIDPPRFEPRREPSPDPRWADEPARRPTRTWPLWAGAAVAAIALIAVFVVARQQPTIDTAAITAAVKAGLPATPPPPAAGPAVVKYGTGKDLFEVEGTPVGFIYDGVSDPTKAALCKSKYNGTLVKSDTCRLLSNGQRECKDVCRLPNGKTIGTLAWK